MNFNDIEIRLRYPEVYRDNGRPLPRRADRVRETVRFPADASAGPGLATLAVGLLRPIARRRVIRREG